MSRTRFGFDSDNFARLQKKQQEGQLAPHEAIILDRLTKEAQELVKVEEDVAPEVENDDVIQSDVEPTEFNNDTKIFTDAEYEAYLSEENDFHPFLIKMGSQAEEPESIDQVASAISNKIFRNHAIMERKRLVDGEQPSKNLNENYQNEETKNILVGMAKKAQAQGNSAALASVVHTMGNALFVNDNDKGKELYDNVEVRNLMKDAFLNAKKPNEKIFALHGINLLSFASADAKNFFGKAGIFDEVMQLAQDDSQKSKSSFDDRGKCNIATTLCLSFEKEENTAVSEKQFAALVKFASDIKEGVSYTDRTKANFASLFSQIFEQNSQLMQSEVARDAKGLMLKWADEVTSEASLKSVCSTLSYMSKLASKESDNMLFEQQDVKEQLFSMGTKAKESNAVASVCSTIANINLQLNQKRKAAKENGAAEPAEIYADEETYSFMRKMVDKVDKAKGKDGDAARGAVASAIGAIASGEKGAERFCNQETKDTLLQWAKKASTDKSIMGICSAISAMALHEAKMTKKDMETDRENIFLHDPKVTKALDGMRSRIDSQEEGKSKGAKSKTENALNKAKASVENGSWVKRTDKAADQSAAAGKEIVSQH